MIDYFALLGEPRRPWVDGELLKEKFHALSAGIHPDRLHNAPAAARMEANQKYAEMNSAYNCLREHKDRLLHLLELEQGSKPQAIERIPADATEMFLNIAQTLRGADNFLSQKSKVISPLVKVQWFERGMEWTGKLQAALELIESRRQVLVEELVAMNPRWVSAPDVGDSARPTTLPLARVEELYRQFSYFHRWSAQIRERITQIAL